MSFLKAGLRGHNFLEKNIGVFLVYFLPNKYEGFRSSVVEHESSNARVASSHPGLAKTFFSLRLP